MVILVAALKGHDYDSVLKETETIAGIENQADQAHLKAVENICSGSFFGGIREDILTLLENIDNIADSAKGASRIFFQRRISDDVIDYLFKEDLVGFVQTCNETVDILKNAVISLGKNKTEVIKLAGDVERSEERADAIRAKIVENLLKNEINADVLDIIMLKDFLDVADDVADDAEDCSDVLLILVAKGYT